MDERVRVASVGDLGPERPVLHYAAVGEREVLLVAFADGSIYAVDALCTHGYGYLDQGRLDGHELRCPLHEGRFDVRTGKATRLPAEEPLGSYPVSVTDGEVFIEVGAP